MTVKLNVGFTRKLGQPNYGSVGASCNIECDLDSELLFRDPGGFQQQVKDVYTACTQAVHDELARRQHGAVRSIRPGNGQAANAHGHAPVVNDQGNGNGPSNTRSQAGRLATQAQARAIYSIANRQNLDLPALLRERFDCDRPDDLSLTDASRLIDELQNAPVNGAAAPP